MTISNKSDISKERRELLSELEEQAVQAVAWKAPAAYESAR